MVNAYEIRDILKIGIEITTEKIKSRLLEKMLEKAMTIANCDAGTLYIVKDGCLYFRIMRREQGSINLYPAISQY